MRRVTLRGDSWYEKYELFPTYKGMISQQPLVSSSRRSFIGVI